MVESRRAERTSPPPQERLISKSGLLPWVAVAALVLLAAAGGGVVGGLLVVAVTGEATPAAAPAPGAPVPAASTNEGERLRAAIQRALPAVVTVLVDLPSREVEDGVLIRQNIGSGIVVSDRGHVLTNYHVVQGAERIVVALSTGERRDAVLVDDDSPYHDVAVLRVPPQGLRAATLGDSDRLALGETVAAVAGGLVTFENQAKVGVVSATHVDFPRPGVILPDMIQTDAAVNHGDSGGALVNLDGEVVGLLTTVVRRTPDGLTVEGVALAHSSNSIRGVVEAIVATGANPRPRYGIERLHEQHLPITGELAAAEGLPVSEGALIVEVAAGSPAEAAGVRPGDIVVGVSGLAVNGEQPLVNIFDAVPGDGTAELFILREGAQLRIRVTPAPGGGQRSG
jgi:S1-C subfamily serine protease